MKDLSDRRMTKEDSDALRGDMDAMLADKDCRDFINEIVNKAIEQHPHINPNPRDLLSVFDKIGSQGGYFWVSNAPINSLGPSGGQAVGSFRTNDAKIALGDSSRRSPFLTAEQNRIIDAVGALHETIHHLNLDDTVLSHALGTLRGLDPNPYNYPYEGSHSLYWGVALEWHCGQALKKAIKEGRVK